MTKISYIVCPIDLLRMLQIDVIQGNLKMPTSSGCGAMYKNYLNRSFVFLMLNVKPSIFIGLNAVYAV